MDDALTKESIQNADDAKATAGRCFGDDSEGKCDVPADLGAVMQSPAASLCISSLQLQLHSGREGQRVVPRPRPQILSMRKEAAERVIFLEWTKPA